MESITLDHISRPYKKKTALLNRRMIFGFESFAALTLALSFGRGNKTLSSLLLGEKGWG